MPRDGTRFERSVNACVVGHGMMGDWHARALRDTGCTLHTLVGRRPEPTRAFAVSHGFGHHTTDLAEALARPEVDLVILASPSEQHAASAELVLAHGKHLLVEIPLAMSLAEADALVARADELGLVLGVVHPLRARVELVALRERLRLGEERLQVMHGRFFTHRFVNVGATGYARSWTDNLLWHHVAHLVDAALWLADAPVTRVASWMAPVNPRTGTPMEVSLIAETASPSTITVSASYSAHEHVFDLMAVTDADSYRLDVRASTLTSRVGAVEIEAEEANCARVTRDFVRAVRERRDPLVTGRSVLPAMAVLEQVQRAWDGRYGAQSLPGRPLI